jgi:hypothetical protein
VFFVEQYRESIEDIALELPAGMIDAGEEPKDAARRELEEETGIKVEVQICATGESPYTKVTSAYNAGSAPTMAMLDPTDVVSLAKEYALDNIVKVHDYIPRSEIVDRMHRSSIMLVLTTPIGQYGTHGMMGTKFYEILGVEKPCLCLNSDEECLADAIENTHAGLAATKVEDVKAFILDKYQEWKENGYTHQAVIDKEQYTRQHEAKQFEQLFLQCIK